jgi:WD40 repeat protein
MTTYQTKQIKTDHNDLIQDIAFDFYGKRAATASLDQSVKIWNINDNNEWVFKEELKVTIYFYLVLVLFMRRNAFDKSYN